MNAYSPATMPWWKSRVIVGALVSIVMKLLVVSGLTGDFTADESQQLVDLALILIGAIGDVVVIASRVRQRHAPAITASAPPKGILSIFLACALLFPLASCSHLDPSGAPRAPVDVSEGTKIDEQAALTITLAYTGAARAAALAIETGLVDDPTTVARVGEIDRRAYAAVQATEAAYRAGNAASYAAGRLPCCCPALKETACEP